MYDKIKKQTEQYVRKRNEGGEKDEKYTKTKNSKIYATIWKYNELGSI